LAPCFGCAYGAIHHLTWQTEDAKRLGGEEVVISKNHEEMKKQAHSVILFSNGEAPTILMRILSFSKLTAPVSRWTYH